jgi:hypothetical protein
LRRGLRPASTGSTSISASLTAPRPSTQYEPVPPHADGIRSIRPR